MRWIAQYLGGPLCCLNGNEFVTTSEPQFALASRLAAKVYLTLGTGGHYEYS